MIRIACKTMLIWALVSSFGLLWAQQDSSSQSGSAAPDNTKTNQRDRNDAQTADRQSNSAPDIETTRQIRKALVNDKSLSTYGHNVKVITQQGIVILKGPVRSEAEKEEIESKAVTVTGSADSVHSELEVVGNTDGNTKAKPPASSDDH